MKIITIVIDKIGQVTLQTHGFDGQACKDASKAMERSLGMVLSDKPSFDQPIQQSVIEANH